jgi:hypothetical protein
LPRGSAHRRQKLQYSLYAPRRNGRILFKNFRAVFFTACFHYMKIRKIRQKVRPKKPAQKHRQLQEITSFQEQAKAISILCLFALIHFK